MIVARLNPLAVINLAGLATLKASRTVIGAYDIYNANGTVGYIQLFDVASINSVTLGTTPPNAVIPLAATSRGANEVSAGLVFLNGLVAACTTTANGATTVTTPVSGFLGVE